MKQGDIQDCKKFEEGTPIEAGRGRSDQKADEETRPLFHYFYLMNGKIRLFSHPQPVLEVP